MELHSHDDVGLENAGAVCVCIRLDEDGNAFERRVRTMICMRCERFAEGSDNMDKQVNRLDLRSLQYLNPLPHVHSHRCRESLLREGQVPGRSCSVPAAAPTRLRLEGRPAGIWLYAVS